MDGRGGVWGHGDLPLSLSPQRAEPTTLPSSPRCRGRLSARWVLVWVVVVVVVWFVWVVGWFGGGGYYCSCCCCCCCLVCLGGWLVWGRGLLL